MSNREPRYFDFIHQHEKKLNLIYSRWEAQIAKQNAANKSGSLLDAVAHDAKHAALRADRRKTTGGHPPAHRAASLFNKIGQKKTALAGMAIALGSVLVAWQYGTDKVAAWQNQRQLETTRNSIAANSQKLDQIAWKLSSAAYNNRLQCVQPGYIYELSSGRVYNRALMNQPRAFLNQHNTVSLIRTNVATQKPDAYVRLNPDRNLLYGSIEEDRNGIEAKAYSIDLDREPEDLPLEAEELKRYAEVQSKAIALHEELSSCSGNLGLMPHIPHFPYAD